MSAEARIAALPLWNGRPSIEPIAAGRTNRNFLVQANGKRFFARVGQDIPEHGILRSAERRCAQLAAEAGLAPQIVFAESGIIITEYIDGEPLSAVSIDSATLRLQIADLLRQLHLIPRQPDLPRFCPVAASHRYLAGLDDRALPVPRAHIEARLDALSSPPPHCLIHGDLIPENFILAGDRLLLVDWEYAGNGVPETDIAMVLSNFGLAAADAADFLGACGPLDHAVLEEMRVAAIIREALWCVMQANIGGMVGDLPRIHRALPRSPRRSSAVTAQFDIAIIGGGVVGTAIARELSRYQLSTVLLEARPELGDESSKGNSALMCSGIDVPSGTLERQLVQRGYARYLAEAPGMGLPIRKVGAIILAWSEEQERTLAHELDGARRDGFEAELLDSARDLSPLAAFRPRHPLRAMGA